MKIDLKSINNVFVDEASMIKSNEMLHVFKVIKGEC